MIELLGFSQVELPSAVATAPAPLPERSDPPPEPAPQVTLRDVRSPDVHPGDTSLLVTRLWEATENVGPTPVDWHPEDFSALASSSRTFRWSVVVIGVAVVIGLLAAMQYAMSLPARLAAETTTRYVSAIDSLDQAIPATREAARAVTEPDSDPANLAAAAVALSDLDDAARTAFTTVAEPLPDTPLLVPRDELEALNPQRTSIATAADLTLTVERRLGDALNYRLLFARMFALPELPVAATPDEITDLGVTLGLAITDSATLADQLPDEPFLADHLASTKALVRRLDDWQGEYLEALRRSDADTARLLIDEYHTRISELEQGLIAPLHALGEWAATQLDTLDSTLGRVEAQLPSSSSSAANSR